MNPLRNENFRSVVSLVTYLIPFIVLCLSYIPLFTGTIPFTGITIGKIYKEILILCSVVPVIPFLVFIGFVIAYHCSYLVKKLLDCKFSNKKIINTEIKNWKKGDTLHLKFNYAIRSKSGSYLAVIKDDGSRNIFKTVKVTFKSISDSKHIIVKYKGDLYEMNIHEPIEMNNQNYETRKNKKRQKELKKKIQNKTPYEQAIREVELTQKRFNSTCENKLSTSNTKNQIKNE